MLIQINTNKATTAFDLILIQNFSWTDGSVGKSVINFAVDTSSSVHIDGRTKNIFVLGEVKHQHKA